MADLTVIVALGVLREMEEDEIKSLISSGDWPDFMRRRGRVQALREVTTRIKEVLRTQRGLELEEDEIEDV